MGKSRALGSQSFPEALVSGWLLRLEEESVKSLVNSIVRPASPASQLKAVKKVELEVRKEELKDVNLLLGVLVEMHSACSARHPLQRAISSMLTKLPNRQQQDTVVELIAVNVARAVGHHGVLMGYQIEHSSDKNASLSSNKELLYVSSLLENFVLGVEGLKRQLPLVLEFCLKSLDHISSVPLNTGYAIGVLVEALKITMSLLHKFSSGFFCTILQDSDWPAEKLPTMLNDRERWIKEMLAGLTTICEGFLSRDDLSPDPTLAAAMLLVVIGKISMSFPSFLLDEFSSSVVHWLALVEQKPFSTLCLYYAFLAKLPPQVLTDVKLDGESFLLAMFSCLCDLFDRFTESSERCIAACTLTLWSVVARDYLMKGEGNSTVLVALSPNGNVLSTLLSYVWSLWEDPLDGVRYQCKEIFENIICIYQLLAPDKMYGLAESLLSLDSPTRSKFVFLMSLAPHVSAKELLSRHPGLPTELLSVMGHQALACHAGDLWSKLVSLHWQECSGKEEEETTVWADTWVLPLLQSMYTSSQLARRHIAQHCLPSLFRSTNCMDYITAKMQTLTSSPECRVTAHLACLRCAKAECKNFTVSSESFSTIFRSSIHHSEEQVRLFALAMMCECVKTTDAPPPSQLRLLLDFVEVNGNSQSAGFRYPVLASFKKVLCRVRDSTYVMQKSWLKKHGPDPEELIKQYKVFLEDLLNQQFEHLHPVSSYQRRNFSLSILQLLAAAFPFPWSVEATPTCLPTMTTPTGLLPEAISSIFVFSEAVSESQAKCLLDGLRDPYEANRSICLALLQDLPISKIKLSEASVVTKLVNRFLFLISQPKSVSCSSAACLLKLFLFHCNQAFNLHLCLALPGNSFSLEEKAPEQLHSVVTMVLLCQLLDSHTSQARKDLVTASMKTPMYGVLQSIRTVIEHGLLEPDSQNFKHSVRDVMCSIVEQCKDLSEVVSPVVCSSSPEGFFPDFNSYSKLLPDEGQSTSGNAQSLLLCCWHTMKEVSLVLGILVENFSEPLGNMAPILGNDQMDMIAGIFTHQLTEARHRGAFEMAYTGFSKLCCALWTSSDSRKSMMPRAWMQDLLDSLQSSSVAKLLTVTRRSAGLPFFVQGILGAETSLSGRPCLKMAMEVLLKVAHEAVIEKTSNSSVQSPIGENEDTAAVTEPAAVHALNILRALFRDSKLGEHVVAFIPKGVKIAIAGFGAALWPVRNSSNLLFTSLILRIFGAKRVMDEHSMENKMTAREFFARFPDLHGYLLQQLQLATEKLEADRNQGSLQPSLLPLLLLLSRLYPSPLDEANSPTSLSPFIPLLIRCTCCHVWKTRVLASHAASLMLTQHNCWSILNSVYSLMERQDQNKLHGLLLLVGRSLQDRGKLLSQTKHSGKSVLCYLLELHLTNLSIGTWSNKCPITQALYLEILLSFLGFQDVIDHLRKDITLHSSLSILSIASGDLCKSEVSLNANEEVYSRRMELLLKLTTNFEDIFKPETANEIFKTVAHNSKSEVVQKCALKCMKLLREYCSLSSEPLVQLLKELTSRQCKPDLLIEVFGQLCTHLDRLKMENLELLVSQANHYFQQQCCRIDFREVLIKFLTCSLLVLYNHNIYLPQCLESLLRSYKDLTVPTHPDQLRVAIAASLLELWPQLIARSGEGEVTMLIDCCHLVVSLLQDPDADVRIEMANAVARLLQGAKGCDFDSLNSSSALKCFVTLLPKLLLGNEKTCFVVLTSFLEKTPSVHKSSTNPLFDEDPVNDYEEKVVLMQHVMTTLKHCIETSNKFAAAKMELMKYLASEEEVIESEEVMNSWWERSGNYLKYIQDKRIRCLMDLPS